MDSQLRLGSALHLALVEYLEMDAQRVGRVVEDITAGRTATRCQHLPALSFELSVARAQV